MLKKIEGLKEICCAGYHYYTYINDKGITLRQGNLFACPHSNESVIARQDAKERYEKTRIINQEYFQEDMSKTFENFDAIVNGMVEQISEIYAAAQNIKNKRLIFIGKPGRGKTHICHAIKNFNIEIGIDLLYSNSQIPLAN